MRGNQGLHELGYTLCHQANLNGVGASESPEEQPMSASNDKSAENPITDNAQLIAKLVKKVEALERHNREAAEQSLQ